MSNSTASGVDSISSTSQFTSSPLASSTSILQSTTTFQVTSQSPTSASSTPTTRTTIAPTTPTAPTSTTPDTAAVSTAVVTFTPTSNGSTLPATTETITSTASPNPATGGSSTSSSSSSSGTAGLVSSGSNNSGSSGLSGAGKIAVAVVVPIVAVALIVIALIFLWRKRKQRKDAEELRRKEVEEYGYNPNDDPTLPAVGVVGGNAAGHDGPFEMREEGSSGYRGWGTTAVGSGRKESTTLSGGNSGGIGMAYSEGTSPTHGPVSDTRSGDPLVGSSPNGRPLSGGSEVLGAMGPATSSNRNDDMHRGPSNASSSYSAANRSDGSGEAGVPGGALGAAQYYSNDQYGNTNPYTETSYGSPPGRAEMSGQPIIRDVQARRNTRIENPSHFPQQSAGISQNF